MKKSKAQKENEFVKNVKLILKSRVYDFVSETIGALQKYQDENRSIGIITEESLTNLVNELIESVSFDSERCWICSGYVEVGYEISDNGSVEIALKVVLDNTVFMSPEDLNYPEE